MGWATKGSPPASQIASSNLVGATSASWRNALALSENRAGMITSGRAVSRSVRHQMVLTYAAPVDRQQDAAAASNYSGSLH